VNWMGALIVSFSYSPGIASRETSVQVTSVLAVYVENKPEILLTLYKLGMRWRSGLRSYATNPKVVGSIPDEVIPFILIWLILSAALWPHG
jgi:hypothetical protein